MSLAALTQLEESEQEHLRDALQRLLTQGAIMRDEPGQRDLYEWCRVQRTAMDALAALAGLRLIWEHESRFIQALPDATRLLRRLRQDETLIGLALWYDFHRLVAEEGRTLQEVTFTVREFNEQLAAKFTNNIKLPTATRLREILALFERKSLVRLRETASDFSEVVIQVLPTIRHVIPVPAIEEWQRVRDRHVKSAAAAETISEPTDSAETTDDQPQD
jgi:hypothetical protein